MKRDELEALTVKELRLIAAEQGVPFKIVASIALGVATLVSARILNQCIEAAEAADGPPQDSP